jgi:hydroxymethylbilane synthase
MTEEDPASITIGTRQSQLALKQTEMVSELLKSDHASLQISLLPMSTRGDQILDRPLAKVGSKSLFTGELEQALLDGRVDCVVHSLKDMPTTQPQGLTIGAIMQREDPRDAVVLTRKSGHDGRGGLESLPAGAVIGTSSNRRIAQLRHHFPHLQFQDIVSFNSRRNLR